MDFFSIEGAIRYIASQLCPMVLRRLSSERYRTRITGMLKPHGEERPVVEPCTVESIGLIGDRWRDLGAEAGPLGCPVEPEHDVTGWSGRRQAFEHGEIAWSAGQKAMVWVYRLEDYAVFEWE